MRLFAVNALYSYKALFRWQSPEAYVLQKMMFPLIQLTFFALIGQFGGSRPLAFYLIGNCIAVAFRPMFSITTAIADERNGGTLPFLIASPASRIVLFFGRATLHVIDGMFDIVVAFAFAIVVFGLRLPDSSLPGMALAVLVASLAACGMGFFLGALAYVVLDAVFLANVVMFALLLLTGANIPLSELPAPARAFGEALPLTHTIAAARAYAQGLELEAGLPLLIGDVILGLLWALGGFALFTLLEHQARRRGTLEAV